MLIVFACLGTSAAAAPPESAGPLVEDLIWVHARPSDGVEHLTVRPTERGLEVYFFLRPDPEQPGSERSAAEQSAQERVRALLGRVHGPLARHGLALDHRWSPR
ncbi:hypothetical protein AB0O31_31760 [Kitasatospora cineracea]|uniref:hypothetical protein n=1 Tax=Kitasatospora cineracea TaxID=88074 RepID=UPI003443EE84